MPTQTEGDCPICELKGQSIALSDHEQDLKVECHRCGQFELSRTVAHMIKQRGVGPRLCPWIRDKAESGSDIPVITRESLDQVLDRLPKYRVPEKHALILRALEQRTTFPSEKIALSPSHDFPLAWSKDEGEFWFHLGSLAKRGLIDQVMVQPPTFTITVAGWEYLEAHARPRVISDQAFIAMSFSAELKPAWEQGIRVGLQRAGFRPYRTDAEPHIDRIDAKIITEIKNSKFLVADVTQQRPGVYFEAGYAIGLGLPVFWCVRHDDLENVHFDTRQYSHIVWRTEADLAEQLYYNVAAIIGRGTSSS